MVDPFAVAVDKDDKDNEEGQKDVDALNDGGCIESFGEELSDQVQIDRSTELFDFFRSAIGQSLMAIYEYGRIGSRIPYGLDRYESSDNSYEDSPDIVLFPYELESNVEDKDFSDEYE
ncbi:MAG: hypothetical protein EZS28_007833 [Streblomastix strix]|uniref:Uncharacterized protein n=1 Tax=Streblomastix strix TaxID=222440 RepID=A0A5J4WPM7_9EUKA|nr:MAG: hypothetical protein EZS28_007833 [Streblomastix strix]